MAPSGSSATSVQVALRIRPPTHQDSTSIPTRFQRSVIHATSSTSVSVDPVTGPTTGGPAPAASSASAAAAGKKQVFSFDQVHGPPATQHEMFTSTALPLISRFVEGFNCTILAYGQTSSGKTHTMTGIDLDADPSDPNNGMGIIPRSISKIFQTARQLRDERAGAWTYNIKSSYIEIYNEDLIDLLTDDTGRREVQIREDKDGHIIWGGLREVPVKNPNEVMTLLRKGSSIRRTNETDMNAQSSRSHAIFSLTLTQKKYTGGGAPPRSSSPLPPNGRSPSRLARPGSMYAGPGTSRVASPTGGRPPTPSFASAMGRGGGLRPSSALGHAGDRSGMDDDGGEWVTIVSKFHFVDLAGSERLKRTAAAGERVKEGISINSGLLALGNVISALGDPSRAKSHMSHVPYRDSKLTRLLQDSLGGNAHTLMIACVSPAEWNVGETVNTLKYANRARNIKNNAVVNAKEDGWDDVEWLQGTVRRLRQELKTIKDGGVVPSSNGSSAEPVLEGAGKKVLAQMTELQNNYEDLRGKFVERTEELTRLRRELGERHRGSTGGAIGGTGKYEEIVGPVIEEYEKTISAMEAELNLNRAALRHTNEMVEEKEEELALVSERHSATELYVEELRARVAKLTEREASTEAYVRDLEEKMKSYDESSITSSESMTDLRREVSKYRDSETHSAKYIADLEARLARTDESVLALQQTIEKLESECERRREEVHHLQARLDTLRDDGDNWRSDLEARERKVKELEEKMVEWEAKKKEAGATRERLGVVVGEITQARKSLEVDLVNGHSSSGSATPASDAGTPLASVALIPDAADKHPDEVQPEVNPAVHDQLLSLQQTHTATLADLASVTAKYRDALREISDLAAQIQEAKLSGHNAESSHTVPDSPASETPVERPVEIPPFRRRMTGGRSRESSGSESQYNSAGRRLFFRQAASTESLHQRSLSQSQSLSQELSSVHSRKTSVSTSSSSHSPSNSHSIPSPFLSPHGRPNLSISLPNTAASPIQLTNERSVHSLEKEIMRLQEVLKERETEIASLEGSLKESQAQTAAAVSTAAVVKTNGVTEHEPVTPPGNRSEEDIAASRIHLSPKTISQFDTIRRSMNHDQTPASVTTDTESELGGGSTFSEHDESLERLNELMLSMAQKESHHREIVDGLTEQLTSIRRQHDDLTALSRDQAANMSAEIESLQTKHSDVLADLEQAKEREKNLVESLERTVGEHAQEIEKLQTEIDNAKMAHEKAIEQHDKELQQRTADNDEALAQAQQQHEGALARLAAEHAEVLKQRDAEAAAALQTTEGDYYDALTKLRADHATALESHAAESAVVLERLREEHAAELRVAEVAREGSLSESQSSMDLALRELQDAHAAAVSRKETSFGEELKELKNEHARALTTKTEDHALEMDKLRSSHEGLVAKLKEEWRVESEQLNSALAALKAESTAASLKASADSDKAIQAQKESHAAVLGEIEKGHGDEVAGLKTRHDESLRASLAESETQKAALVAAHAQEITLLKSQHQETIAEVNTSVVSLQAEHREVMETLKARHQRALDDEKVQLVATLEDLKAQHSKQLQTLQKDRDLLAQEIESHKAAAEEFGLVRGEKDALVKSLEEQLATVRAEQSGFEGQVAQLREELDRAQNDHSQQEELQNEISKLKQQLEDSQKQHSTLGAERDDFEAEAARLRGELAQSRSAHSSIGVEKDNLEAQVAKLQAELQTTRDEQSALIQEASKRESLVGELDRHRSILADIQENLQRVKDEKDVLQTEKNRSDTLVRELQAQVLARSSSPPIGNGRPSRATALPAMKLPPPTPPPSVPPPPAPRTNGDSMSSHTSGVPSSSSRDSQVETSATSAPSQNGSVLSDTKTVARLEAQNKQLEEQEAMIKTLNKQLTHCESDLQTHMDLVSTLETSLGDSEKNLRKARMHATELARERDTLNTRIETLRTELDDAKREITSMKSSVVQEKQSYEQRLTEERKAKERARQELDMRVDEMQRRKSKFNCL
ncbi:Kinesin-domain-containing protein [Mycena indigotica]|uniref:Kinesin-domain-containing protein n=1 Tax=Mycena indigotica TaxID=2126181 RepID=A0A8H6VXJ1_9AGAR|nr:Kinesin-domain-containing protein [Mycena indigotica]KAF7295561.1 Kinesin-domain-containing protein [Mycena indigotica]